MAGPDGFNIARTTTWNCPYGAYFSQALDTCVYLDQPEKEPNCGISNPIVPTRGMKVQTEVDGSFPVGNLGVRRTYRSLVARGDSQLAWPVANRWASTMGIGWSLDVMPWLEWPSMPIPNVTYVHRRDGGTVLFSKSGSTWTTDPDVNYTLSAITSGGGEPLWQLYNYDRNVIERYRPDGRIQLVARANGQWEQYQYDDQARLASITDHTGRSLGFTYNVDGYIETLSYAGSPVAQYTYEGGKLIQVSYPDTSQKRYHYGEAAYISTGTTLPYALTGISDERGVRFGTYYYDSNAQANRSEHAGGVDVHTFALYNASTTGYIDVTDPLGAMRRYSYTTVHNVRRLTAQSQPGGSGCGPSGSTMTYDVNGNLSSRTDFAGHKTCYAYDLTRNLETKRVEGLASSANCTTSLTTPPAPTAANPTQVISTQWHPDWHLETMRAEAKKLTTWVYNGQPDPTAGGAAASCAPSTALLPDGKPIAVLCKKIEQATSDSTGSAGFSASTTGSPRIWSWTYNGVGQVLTAKGPRTDLDDSTAYTYYSDTTATHTLGDLWQVTNAAGHVTEYTRYDRNGRLLEVRDPNGEVTTLSYSPRGWLKTRQVGTAPTTYDYDAVGQLKKVILPGGHWIAYDYDPAHRLTSIYDQLGNRISYTLDNAGNRIKEEVTDSSGALARTHSREYDALSRLKNFVQPE